MVDYVRVCESLNLDNGVCSSESYKPAYLIAPEDTTGAQLFLSGGVDYEVIQLGFMGVISLFIAGLTIGLILRQIKQLR